jgi:hypothetical protein
MPALTGNIGGESCQHMTTEIKVRMRTACSFTMLENSAQERLRSNARLAESSLRAARPLRIKLKSLKLLESWMA